MAIDYKRYVAENVLSERRSVTYRLLSRALKVHSNLAKQMLFDIYRTENEKTPNSVSATFMICGVQSPSEISGPPRASNDGNDTVMRSSPYMSSMPQPEERERSVRSLSFVLAREEDLEDAKATFESISMIYIYSLQTNTVPDLNALVDVSRDMLATFGSQDPLEFGEQWGMIQNRNVKRRQKTNPLVPVPVPAPVSAPPKTTMPEKKMAKGEDSQSKVDSGVSSNASSQHKTERSEKVGKAASKETTKPAARKRGDLFSSFANAKPKLQKEDSTASEVKSTAQSTPDRVMFDEDDDAEDGAETDPFSNKTESNTVSNRETRKEREAKLKQMMEDDEDEDMPDAEDTPVESAAEESQQTDTQIKSEADSEPKETVTVQGGRRRGKRKIMKKKTVKDDEGYLVTVEEPAWESFSEEEPVAPPKKKAAISSSTTKKAGQGNIMSFFSKK